MFGEDHPLIIGKRMLWHETAWQVNAGEIISTLDVVVLPFHISLSLCGSVN